MISPTGTDSSSFPFTAFPEFVGFVVSAQELNKPNGPNGPPANLLELTHCLPRKDGEHTHEGPPHSTWTHQSIEETPYIS